MTKQEIIEQYSYSIRDENMNYKEWESNIGKLLDLYATEVLKEVLPEEEDIYNSCRQQIISNAKKLGINV